MANKSFNRVAMNGGAYSPAEADAVVTQWAEISKGLVDKDLRSIQKDLTSKVNNRSPVVFPDDFLNSREVAYRVAGVETKELMARRAREADDHLQKIRSSMQNSANKLRGKALVNYLAVICQKLQKEKGLTMRQIDEIVGLSPMTVWRRLKVDTPYSNRRKFSFNCVSLTGNITVASQ